MTVELFVYGDESGLGNNPDWDPLVVVAGFIAAPRHWERFNKSWSAVVGRAGVTEFHARPFFSRHAAKPASNNEFRGWTDRDAWEFLDDLLTVIHDHRRVAPIGWVMDARVFHRLSWGERNYLTGASWDARTQKFIGTGAPSRAYHLPFFELVKQALEKAGPADCKVHFRMDENKVIEQHLLRLYSLLRYAPLMPLGVRSKMGDLTPGRSEDHPGIQAADLLACLWHYHRSHEGRYLGERARALARLATIWPRAPYEIGAPGLECILEESLPPGARALIKAMKSPREMQAEKRKARQLQL